MTITAEQIAFRRGKIGASSYGQALGRGYGSKTRAELYHQMKGNLPPTTETMAMRVGNFMESFILSEYNIKTGRKGVEFPETQIHPADPRIICHCDGITGDSSRLIEIKNVGPRMHSAWDNGVPEYVWIQCCGQSMVTGVMQVDVAAYFGGSDLKVFELTFTEEDHANLLDGLMDFLGYLDRDEEPPHTIADLPNLDKYYEVTDHYKKADRHIMDDVILLSRMKQDLKITKDAKVLMDQCEFRIKEYMGSDTELVDDELIPLFTWKQGKDKTVTDWEAAFYDGCSSVRPTADIIKDHTTTKKGNRTFLCKIKD
jgi:hypothetical protein